MTLDDALSPLPEGSPYRSIIAALMSPEREVRQRGIDEIRARGLTTPYWEDPEPKDEAVALAVLRAATELDFPPPEDAWERGPEELVFTLLGSAYPSLVAHVEESFTRVDPRLHLDLLTLVASGARRDSAEAFARLIDAHDWPERAHTRFETELLKNLPHADAFVPRLLEGRAYPRILLGNIVLQAISSEALSVASIAESRMIRGLEDRLGELLERIAELRRSTEHDDERDSVESELALLLDLAGYAGEASVISKLRLGSGLPETRPAAFAVASLLRRDEAVGDETLERIASDDGARAPLYELLSAISATSRIPERLRSRDAFAAADMTQWLSHRGELGQPPAALELMEVFEFVREGEPVVLYAWRFRAGDEDPWLAAVSGLYRADPPEGPLHGTNTFSRFDPWDSATPEEHALAVLETMKEWRGELE